MRIAADVARYLGVGAAIARLGLIAHALKAALGFGTEDASGVLGKRHLVAVGEGADILHLEQVAQLDFASETEVSETDLHSLGLVGGVVDGKGAEGAVAALQVLHQRVAVVLIIHDVGLLVEGVLIEGDELGVAQQVEGSAV